MSVIANVTLSNISSRELLHARHAKCWHRHRSSIHHLQPDDGGALCSELFYFVKSVQVNQGV